MAEEEDRHWSEPLNPLHSVRNPKPAEFNLSDWPYFVCSSRAVVAGVASFAIGGAFGLVFQNYDTLSVKDDAPVLRQLKDASRQAWAGARPWARNFAQFGLLYAAFECGMENARGRSDIYNHLVAGCATGASLAWQTGPAGMSMACAGMAAFSLVTESYFNLRGH